MAHLNASVMTALKENAVKMVDKIHSRLFSFKF